MYKEMLTKGMICSERASQMNMHLTTTLVRFTSDEKGETLSLEAGGVMIGVPFEEVAKMIKECRNGRVKNA